MTIDGRTANRLERLFDQQMWLFGCDVRRPGDNLLARRGLTRTAPVPGAQTSGTWSGREGELGLAMSSVGVTASWRGQSVRLEREPLRRQLEPGASQALRQLCVWFAAYEAWVVEVAGLAWREAALASRSRRPFVMAADVSAAWAALGREVGSTG